LNYGLAASADQSCCTFQPLPKLMAGLLHAIQYVIPNFGIAIVVLVLIVRTLLHPLAVFQQKSMYRMQEGMARLQPKMQDIKERFANDKVRMNQEIMKLFAEEHINPMAQFVTFIPLFVQMPILVALWSALSTDVSLRHAALDGWWIRDLSAPDALVRFPEPGLTIPILGWLPLIGGMFSNIPSLNVLPILMGVSMFLQQKYMPKPQMQARMEGAKAQAQSQKSKGGMTPEEQMRQQQMVANMMTVLFPIMFYNMPSGLNLYWMASNIFGIFESLRIRRQIDAEKKRRAAEGPRPAGAAKPPTLVGRILKKFAEQMEQVQKQADELSRAKKK
jgi:YidC/Oxa1 family membrane protein insertase